MFVAFYCLGSVAAWSAETKSAKPKKPAEQSVSFRLPRYFASLVDDEQREKLKKIQAGYHARIVSLRMELDELEQEQLKEMERVLTTSQRKSLLQLRGDAGRNVSRSSSTSKSRTKSRPSSAKSSSSKSSSSKSSASKSKASKRSTGTRSGSKSKSGKSGK